MNTECCLLLLIIKCESGKTNPGQNEQTWVPNETQQNQTKPQHTKNPITQHQTNSKSHGSTIQPPNPTPKNLIPKEPTHQIPNTL